MPLLRAGFRNDRADLKWLSVKRKYIPADPHNALVQPHNVPVRARDVLVEMCDVPVRACNVVVEVCYVLVTLYNLGSLRINRGFLFSSLSIYLSLLCKHIEVFL